MRCLLLVAVFSLAFSSVTIPADEWLNFLCTKNKFMDWFGGKHACFYQDCDTNFTTAEYGCNAFGASLHQPSVHSVEESSWMSDTSNRVDTDIYIGLDPETCQWTDGTPLDFQYFENGAECHKVKAAPPKPARHIIDSLDERWKLTAPRSCIFTCVSKEDTPIPSTKPHSTTMATTTVATTSSSPTESPYVVDECGNCSMGGIWMDIIFVVDSSQSMQQTGIDIVQAAIRSTLIAFNMKRPEIRAAIVIYSDIAEVVYGFDSINSDADARNVTIPYRGYNGTNMQAALVKAMNHFDDFPNKINGRRVIVIFGGGYRPGDYVPPTGIATTFQEANGIIVTFDYADPNTPVTEFDNIATPGYELDRANHEILQKALCDANCFCPADSSGYTLGFARKCRGRCVASGGCFSAYENALQPYFAELDCQAKGGHLVSIHDDDRDVFVSRLFDVGRKFWIGLNVSSNTWMDQTPLDFSLWAPNQPAIGDDCAYADRETFSKTEWFTENCRNIMPYVCSIPPYSAATKFPSPNTKTTSSTIPSTTPQSSPEPSPTTSTASISSFTAIYLVFFAYFLYSCR